MSYKIIETLKAERDGVEEFIARTLDGASEQARDLSSTEMETLEQSRSRIQAIDAQLKPLLEWEQTRASALELDKILTRPQNAEPQTRGRVTTAPRTDTIGALFTESEQFRSYNGGSGQRLGIDGSPIELCTRAALVTGSAPGSLLVNDPLKYTAPQASLSTPLLDAISTISVNSGAVEVIRYGLKADGAAIVPEGQLKPEGTFEVTSETVAMPTIAVSAFASRQLLRDAPAARQFIDNQLSRSVLSKLEETVTAAITGATVPELPANSGEETLAHIRRAMAVVQVAGFTPRAVFANPGVLASLDLTLMGLGGASAAVVGSGYWGLDPISVPALGDDEIYVAAPSDGLTLFQRSGVEVYWTDSDIIGEGSNAQSAFRRNILSTVVEMSAVAAVVNASAMVKLVPAP